MFSGFVDLIFALLFFAVSSNVFAEGRLRIYCVRHAEAGHNVVKKWKDVPKEQWPDYVGNRDKLTPEGEKQAELLAKGLEKANFDFIAASSMRRTQLTILPYLKSKNLKAEIWPELMEAGAPGISEADLSKLPPPNENLFKSGKPIRIPDGEEQYFSVREGANQIVPKGMPDAVAVAKRTVEIIKSRFAGSNKKILLVAHSVSGGTLLKILTNDLKAPSLGANTGFWVVEEQEDGTFKPIAVNKDVSQIPL
ncbi:MAG TPA: histidine phosphatase family protein [Victivallales bacterium]|nr:histidine phosphatase family protein [Victivallales bacterium]